MDFGSAMSGIYLFLSAIGNGICRDEHYSTQGNLLLSSFDVAANSKTLFDLPINVIKVLVDFALFCDYANVLIATEKSVSSDQDEVRTHLVCTMRVFEASDFGMSREKFFEERMKLFDL